MAHGNEVLAFNRFEFEGGSDTMPSSGNEDNKKGDGGNSGNFIQGEPRVAFVDIAAHFGVVALLGGESSGN